MKNYLTKILSGSAAVASVLACTVDQITPETQSSELGTLEIVVNAEAPGSKTYLVEDYSDPSAPGVSANWTNLDVLGFFFEGNSTLYQLKNGLADGPTAKFFANFNATIEAGTYKTYAVFPGDKLENISGSLKIDSNKNVQVRFKKYQYPADNTNYDKSADIFVAKPEEAEVTVPSTGKGKVNLSDMQFARVGAVVKLSFSNISGIADDECIEKISFTAPGQTLAGYANVSLEDATIDANSWTWTSSSVGAYFKDLSYGTVKDNLTAYLCVAPCVIPSGNDIIITVDTDRHHIEKSVTAPADIDLTAGHFQPFNVNMSGIAAQNWVVDILDYEALGLTDDDATTRKSRTGHGEATGKEYESVAAFKDEYTEFNNTGDDLIDLDPEKGASKAGLISKSTSGTPKKVVIDWSGIKYAAATKRMEVFASEGSYASVNSLYSATSIGSMEFIKSDLAEITGTEDFAFPNGTKNFGLLVREAAYPKAIKVYWIDERVAQTISFLPADASYELAVGESFESPVASSTNVSAVIIYSSSNEAVATVDASTGEVTLVGGTGTAVITAETAGDDSFTSASASYTIVVGYPSPELTAATTEYISSVKESDGTYTLTFHGTYTGSLLVENGAKYTWWFQGSGTKYCQNDNVTATQNSGELVGSQSGFAKGDILSCKTAIKLTSPITTGNTTGLAINAKAGYLAEWNALASMKDTLYHCDAQYCYYKLTPSFEFFNTSRKADFKQADLKFLIKNFKKNDALVFTIPVPSYTSGTTYLFKCTLNTAATGYLTNYSITCRINGGDWKTPTGLTFVTNTDVPVSYPVSFEGNYGATSIEVKLYVPTSNTAGQFYIGPSISLEQE